MTTPIDPVRSADDEARALAFRLMREARFGTLATVDETGHPTVSLTSFARDPRGTPFVLVSRLAAHTKHLLSDPRCALLVGEPGKGDPLAHPRMTVKCQATPVDREADETVILKTLFLARHPKAALYADFADFLYMRLAVESASLNGGFGKAYRLGPRDLGIG